MGMLKGFQGQRAVAIAALAALGLAAAAGTAAAQDSSAKAGGTVTIYTSVPEDLMNAIAQRFGKDRPGYSVKVYRAGTPDILAKLEAESKSGSVGADVVWVAETTAAEDLKDLSMLRPYSSPEAKSIPDSLKDPRGYYYGSRLINMVIAYNTAKVPEPKSWNVLLDPAYKGRIGIPSPANSGSALYAVGSIVARKDMGWEYLESVRANGGVQLKNNSEAVQKVASGELLVAVALDYQVKNLRDGGSPISYAVPREGLVMVVSPIAILKGAQNPRGAEALLDYVLSKECQRFMSESQSVVPVRPDVETPAGVPSLGQLRSIDSDPVFIKQNKGDIIDRFSKIFTK
jgi:iron(III) transport system substrate-binding protein